MPPCSQRKTVSLVRCLLTTCHRTFRASIDRPCPIDAPNVDLREVSLSNALQPLFLTGRGNRRGVTYVDCTRAIKNCRRDSCHANNNHRPQEATSDASGPEKTPEEPASTQPPSMVEAESVSLEVATGRSPGTDKGRKASTKKVADAGMAVAGAAQGASKTASRAMGSSRKRATSMAKSSLQRATAAAIDLVSTSQGLLASSLAKDLNDLMQGMVKGTATIYDKAMDATYIATHEGGANHRLFDGGHTLSRSL